MTLSIGNIFHVTGSVWGIHRSTMNSPHKGQWHRAWMFYLICARTNGLVSNQDTGNLRCHWTHYDVTVMKYLNVWSSIFLLSSLYTGTFHHCHYHWNLIMFAWGMGVGWTKLGNVIYQCKIVLLVLIVTHRIDLIFADITLKNILVIENQQQVSMKANDTVY